MTNGRTLFIFLVPSVANSATSIKSAVGNSIIDLTHSLESAVEAEVAEDKKREDKNNDVATAEADNIEKSKTSESQGVDNNQTQERDDEVKVALDKVDDIDDIPTESDDVSDEGAHKEETVEEENIKETDFQRQAEYVHRSSTIKSEHM